ncbi:hypothetical protein EV359DRAFT_50836 [Lentinula novae-zelandiae]|nr:hypothetical protein EV359DRAFT_50836 [Lentinula novae-zelandiae]
MEIAHRDWGPRTIDIIRNLIHGGFTFNTLAAYLPPTGYIPPPQRQSDVLGHCPCGFSPGLNEYLSYEHRQDSFLHLVKGRAAILAGGLIACFAREVVDPYNVLDGPTKRALHGQQALCVWDPRQSAAFWDDELTEDEIDLICGTYEIATGKFAQYAIRSWWPRPISWKSSGLNVGYWSSDAENWFQSHMKGILETPGSVKPLSNNQWRSVLKFNTDSPKLSHKNDLLAAEYLRSFLHF